MYFTGPTRFFVKEQWQKEYEIAINKDGNTTGEILKI